MAKIYVVTYELPAHVSIQVEAKSQDEACRKADKLVGSAKFDVSCESSPEIIDIQEYDGVESKKRKMYDVVLEKRSRIMLHIEGESTQDAAKIAEEMAEGDFYADSFSDLDAQYIAVSSHPQE